jgi:hypothetical protein
LKISKYNIFLTLILFSVIAPILTYNDQAHVEVAEKFVRLEECQKVNLTVYLKTCIKRVNQRTLDNDCFKMGIQDKKQCLPVLTKRVLGKSSFFERWMRYSFQFILICLSVGIVIFLFNLIFNPEFEKRDFFVNLLKKYGLLYVIIFLCDLLYASMSLAH